MVVTNAPNFMRKTLGKITDLVLARQDANLTLADSSSQLHFPMYTQEDI